MDQFVLTPSSSAVDLLIEKFRVEVSRSIDEANAGTRKLTLTSSVRGQPSEVNSNIDQQITDLENLIKKLQDEISEMCQNADKEVKEYEPIQSEDSCEIHRDLSNETIILANEFDNSKETEKKGDTEEIKISKECFESDPYTHVFPVMVRDVILPFNGCFKPLEQTVTSVLNAGTDGKVMKKVIENDMTVKQDTIDVWDDLPDCKLDDNLEVLIDKLQAEISEKMEILKDVNIHESGHNFEAKKDK